MRYSIVLVVLLALACKSKPHSKESAETLYRPNFSPGPHVLVYKTSGDYRNNVPVMMSENDSDIVAYPHPGDIKATESTVYPTILKNGYLIDNRGISNHVAFLKLSYSDYAKLDSVPALSTLKSWIIAKNAITEMCDCGDRSGYTDIEKQINDIIDQDSLHTICKKVF
jgi:hypothetical protein